MKLRDRVGELIDKKKISELQIEANEIFTKNKYFGKKGGKMIYKVHWIVDGVAEIEVIQKRMKKITGKFRRVCKKLSTFDG